MSKAQTNQKKGTIDRYFLSACQASAYRYFLYAPESPAYSVCRRRRGGHKVEAVDRYFSACQASAHRYFLYAPELLAYSACRRRKRSEKGDDRPLFPERLPGIGIPLFPVRPRIAQRMPKAQRGQTGVVDRYFLSACQASAHRYYPSGRVLRVVPHQAAHKITCAIIHASELQKIEENFFFNFNGRSVFLET